MSKHTETPIGRELVERLTEIAYRDTAQSVTVRADDLRAAVRAVNAHEGLLRTLVSIAEDCRRGAHMHGMTPAGVSDIAARCDAALSAAKE